ncbi:MAG: transposase [Polyangiaceae bacterium]|nr:transposase [Polyangiaceae bacterium]
MKDDEDRRLDIAAFRHRLLADALDADENGVRAALARTAAAVHRTPAGDEIRVGASTLWRWLQRYRQGGLLALRPTPRKDRGAVRAVPAAVLDHAFRLRREKPGRPTRTIRDILVRQHVILPRQLPRSTLDRHFARAGLCRRALRALGRETFRLIETSEAFELVVGDFHHGPYVRAGADDTARRALFGGFIDHFSRYVPEGRYYLHEDFAALRFGFRRLLLAHGPPITLLTDHGSAYQATRFQVACEALGIHLAKSKPYRAEARGLIERFNRSLKEQFESEVRGRDLLPTLDELNAWFEAWLAERYHRDVHSETGETPTDRFARSFTPRPVPDLQTVDEYLRLREQRTVHRKWSTVEVQGFRFVVHPSLRGRRVHVLVDPFDLGYVLIAYDGRVVERALPQKPGAPPPVPDEPPASKQTTDYLALLRADYERRTRTELSALRLQPPPVAELDLPGLVAALERCRTAALTDAERAEASAAWRRLRPIDPDAARTALDRARRRLGDALHLRLYLEALTEHLVRVRTKKGDKKP